MRRLQRYFIAGLLIVLPAFISVYLLYAIFTFIDGIWGKLINIYLKKHLGFGVPGLGFILGILVIFITGFIAANFLGRKLLSFFEHWFMKFPFIRQIYVPAKYIVHSFISKDTPAFKKVVMVEYPCKGIWSIGFITNESFKAAEKTAGEELMHVFIGTTPSPFSGFLILVPKKDVKYPDISVEDGIKLIVSGGIIKP